MTYTPVPCRCGLTGSRTQDGENSALQYTGFVPSPGGKSLDQIFRAKWSILRPVFSNLGLKRVRRRYSFGCCWMRQRAIVSSPRLTLQISFHPLHDLPSHKSSPINWPHRYYHRENSVFPCIDTVHIFLITFGNGPAASTRRWVWHDFMRSLLIAKWWTNQWNREKKIIIRFFVRNSRKSQLWE